MLSKDPPGLQTKFRFALAFAQDQVRRLITKHPDYFPEYTLEGRWKHPGVIWTHWCEGFLPGMMWVFFAQTGDPWWRERAENYSRLIEGLKVDSTTHDLGFLFWSSWKRWYDLTGDPYARQVVITAGRTMGRRYMPEGGYLRSYAAPESLYIDIMMNVGIVFYAAQGTGDAELLRLAHQHCQVTRRFLVRGDGSTAQEGLFDSQTGEFLRQCTRQGWSPDSCWARGLTWALYGFGNAYAMTGIVHYRDTARKCADYYLKKTPFETGASAGPGIPPYDFDDPRQPVLVDSSAAAIAASGLLQLSRDEVDPDRAGRYRQAAFTILDTLSSPAYLAFEDPDWEGILKQAVYHYPEGVGVGESGLWGDYFFVEALDVALKLLESGPHPGMGSGF